MSIRSAFEFESLEGRSLLDGSFPVAAPPEPAPTPGPGMRGIVDTTPPLASVQSAPWISVANPGGSTYTFTVEYTDDGGGVSTASLGAPDVYILQGSRTIDAVALVSLTGVGGAPVDGVTPAPMVRATYRINVPGGSWDSGDDGLYYIMQRGGEVRDAAANAAPFGSIGTFRVDVSRPTAQLVRSPSINIASSGSAFAEFDVKYDDVWAVDASTINNLDAYVVGPAGVIYPVSVSRIADDFGNPASGNAQVRTVTYRMEAPQGTWNNASDGLYWVVIQTGQVTDESGNAVVFGSVGTFSADSTAPAAALISSPFITFAQNGSQSYDFVVKYIDNWAVQYSSLNATDVYVVGPSGVIFGATPVKIANDVGQVVTGDGTPRTVTYRMNAPNGLWDPTDDGLYYVVVQAAQVMDHVGNAAAFGSIGTFTADLTPPAVSVANVTGLTPGSASVLITVQFNDNWAVNPATVGLTDLRVYSPLGSTMNAIELVAADPASLGASRRFTFRFAAPGGGWDALDDGIYTIALVGAVSDHVGNNVPTVPGGLIGTFAVAL